MSVTFTGSYNFSSSRFSTEQNNEKIFLMTGCHVLENRVVDRKYEKVGYSVPIFTHIRGYKSTGVSVSKRAFIQTTRGALMLTDKRLIVNPVNEGLKPIIFPYKKIEGFNITGNQIELFIGKEYPIKIEITDNISDNIGKVVHAVGKILELES